MATNPFGPLYNSVQARGRMSPLGAPGALMPKDKKKGLGSKMASALGSMMDQAAEAKQVAKKERIAQLYMRNEEIQKSIAKERKNSPHYNKKGEMISYTQGNKDGVPNPKYYGRDATVTTELPGMNGEMISLNPDYIASPNPREDGVIGEPSMKELELYTNLNEINRLQGTPNINSRQYNESYIDADGNLIEDRRRTNFSSKDGTEFGSNFYPVFNGMHNVGTSNSYFEAQPSAASDQGSMGDLLGYAYK